MKLLGISGSLRAGSTNTKLVHEAARLFQPSSFELADLRLPLFDEDLEEKGTPEEVTRLQNAIRGADAIVISTPEYNKAPPGVLKNALDWVSRAKPWPTEGKPCAIMSAAAGIAGGQRSQYALILSLIAFKLRLVPTPEVSVGQSFDQFDDDGRLTNEKTVELLEAQMRALRSVAEGGTEPAVLPGAA